MQDIVISCVELIKIPEVQNIVTSILRAILICWMTYFAIRVMYFMAVITLNDQRWFDIQKAKIKKIRKSVADVKASLDEDAYEVLNDEDIESIKPALFAYLDNRRKARDVEVEEVEN
jgi:uncharacterized membrane protein YfbV (UPF0208 family)